jgi:hypothetical protein
MDDVDELADLLDDLLEASGVAGDADRHPREVRVAAFGDDERIDVLYAENIEGGELKHYIELWNKATSRGY